MGRSLKSNILFFVAKWSIFSHTDMNNALHLKLTEIDKLEVKMLTEGLQIVTKADFSAFRR
jgi:hypothetical protein